MRRVRGVVGEWLERRSALLLRAAAVLVWLAAVLAALAWFDRSPSIASAVLVVSAVLSLVFSSSGSTTRPPTLSTSATTDSWPVARCESRQQAGGARNAAAPWPPVVENNEIEVAVKEIIKPGRVGFNPPAKMHQGDRERISVTIARSRELDDELRAGLTGRGVTQLEDLSTSPFMTVQLRGTAFDVTPLGPEEQLIWGVTLWEFDVVPLRAGRHILQLCVCMKIKLPDGLDELVARAIPVFERNIHVRVDPVYNTRQFASHHWKWILTTIAGLGSAIAAWIGVVHGRP